MANEQTLTFEEQTILSDKGLLPESGVYNEEMSMESVKSTERAELILDHLKKYGFQETREISLAREEVISFAKWKTPEVLKDKNELQEFGELLGRYQQRVVESGPVDYTNALVNSLMTAIVFLHLNWQRELEEELNLALELAENLNQDLEPLLISLFDS